MENFNFKEVAEKCLSGELSGSIIIEHIWRGSYIVPSKNLILYEPDSNHIYKYRIRTEGVKGAENLTTYFASFSTDGESESGQYKVVDFIPDNNMDLKERLVRLSLEKAKEWYRQGGELRKVALQAFSEDELKAATKPRSWKEYCKNQKGKSLYYINENGIDTEIGIDYAFRELNSSVKNTLPSKELAGAFLAMMQLMSLRQEWIHIWSLEGGLTKDWEPDWSKGTYCVAATNSSIFAAAMVNFTHPLSFPTQEMANEFLDCFKDLLEEAKGLY